MIERIKLYLLRAIRIVIKGELKVFVRVDSVLHGKLLLGKNIIVTGASSGIGYEIVKKCLLKSGNVLCVACTESYSHSNNRCKRAFRSEEVAKKILFLLGNAS